MHIIQRLTRFSFQTRLSIPLCMQQLEQHLRLHEGEFKQYVYDFHLKTVDRDTDTFRAVLASSPREQAYWLRWGAEVRGQLTRAGGVTTVTGTVRNLTWQGYVLAVNAVLVVVLFGWVLNDGILNSHDAILGGLLLALYTLSFVAPTLGYRRSILQALKRALSADSVPH